MKSTFNRKVFISTTALILASCQHDDPTALHMAHIDGELSLKQMMAENARSDQNAQIIKGMQALIDKDYSKANRLFNVILIDDPLNSGVHTLNALTYQLMAKEGDPVKYDLALAGYEQALKIDPNNTFASLQLGRVFADRRDYVSAQEQFSKVLLHDPNNIEAQFELASVSYHLGDLKTAIASIQRVMVAKSNKPEYVRAAALIYAAANDMTQAQVYLERYKALEPRTSNFKYVAKRLDDWARMHNTKHFVVAQATPDNDDTDDAAPSSATPGGGGDTSDPAAPAPLPASAPKGTAKAQQSVYAPDDDDMVVIDVTVMRVSERGSTSKGNNILEKFTLALSPWNYFKARNTIGGITGSSVGPAPGATGIFKERNNTSTLITQGISFGAIDYALNIANSANEYIEVIGRPTLTTGIGKKAEFFSGSSIKIAVSGNFGGNVTDTPVGFKLNVTPTKLQGEQLTMDVQVEGSTLTETLPNGLGGDADNIKTFAILKSNVDTNIKMKLGETIILGGISERTQTNRKSGVPLLQNIPGIQYLFSNEATAAERRSVIYMLTPRSHKNVQRKARQYFSHGQEFGHRPNLSQLELRHKDWFDPGYHQISILDKLGPAYTEFRTGDLKKLGWHKSDSIEQELEIIAGYLWY